MSTFSFRLVQLVSLGESWGISSDNFVGFVLIDRRGLQFLYNIFLTIVYVVSF